MYYILPSEVSYNLYFNLLACLTFIYSNVLIFHIIVYKLVILFISDRHIVPTKIYVEDEMSCSP